MSNRHRKERTQMVGKKPPSSVSMVCNENYNPATFKDAISNDDALVLFEKAKHGDLTARNKIVEHNMKLVFSVIRQFKFDENNRDDIVSIGMFGLMQAVDTFNPNNEAGATFATYATTCIRNAIRRDFFRSGYVKYDVVVMSLDEPVSTADDGDEVCLLDAIPNGEDTSEMVTKRMQIDCMKKVMQDCLTEREKYILSKTFGFGDNKRYTQIEIAKEYGVTRQRISRDTERAIEKIREGMRRNGWDLS